jgi:hypothetical protein
MKFTLLASCLSLAATIAAAPAPAPELEERTLLPFGCLNSFLAQQIVNKYISILENQPYNGQDVNTTAQQIIASNYVEYSDSILSLEKAPVSTYRHTSLLSQDRRIAKLITLYLQLGNTPSATSRDQWVSEVTQHPETGIQTLAVMNDCTRIMWFWNFPHVGSGQYEAST